MEEKTNIDEGVGDTASGVSTATQTDPESMPEAEMLKAENESLRRSLQIATAREKVLAALRAEGAESAELLFEAVKERLQFEHGEPANTPALVAAMKHEYPEQFGSRVRLSSIDGAAGQTSATASISRESLRQMKPEQIAKLDWNEVKQVLCGK